MFSDGRTNQSPDAEVSAVRASVGTAAGHGDDVPEVQIVAVEQTEAVATRRSTRAAGVREHDRRP